MNVWEQSLKLEKLDDTLKGKTVIVTAGNRGGGAAIALRYAASLANVVIIANKEEAQCSAPQLKRST